MMIYNSSVFVAVFAACLVSFPSNSTSAAVIDARAVTSKLKDTVLANNAQQQQRKKNELDCCARRIIFLYPCVLFLPF